MPSCSLPGNRYGHRPNAFPYLALHRAGFTMPPALPPVAVRPYRTGSPLPPRPKMRHGGGMFSVALFLPSGRPALQLAGALARRCSDFPLPNARSTRWAAAARPPRLLITVTPAPNAQRDTSRAASLVSPPSARQHHDRRTIVSNCDVINQRMHRVAGSAPIDICRQVRHMILHEPARPRR